MTTSYAISAYDAHGEWLDITGSPEGDFCIIEGAREAITKVHATKSGILHDFDSGTQARKRVAYITMSEVGRTRVDELYVTKWGRRCNILAKALQWSTRRIAEIAYTPECVYDI